MLVMILARRTGYDPDPFELTSTCGTMEYGDTHNRQMLHCGSIVSWIGRSCERRGRSQWFDININNVSWICLEALSGKRNCQIDVARPMDTGATSTAIQELERRRHSEEDVFCDLPWKE